MNSLSSDSMPAQVQVACYDSYKPTANLVITLLHASDFTSLFTWNTKQLFVYVSAEYTSADGVRNSVGDKYVLWI